MNRSILLGAFRMSYTCLVNYGGSKPTSGATSYGNDDAPNKYNVVTIIGRYHSPLLSVASLPRTGKESGKHRRTGICRTRAKVNLNDRLDRQDETWNHQDPRIKLEPRRNLNEGSEERRRERHEYQVGSLHSMPVPGTDILVHTTVSRRLTSTMERTNWSKTSSVKTNGEASLVLYETKKQEGSKNAKRTLPIS